MLSLKLSVLAVAAALFSAVRADYYIDPTSVDLATRKVWCQNEIAACPLICEQTSSADTKVNTCDATTLTYGCICGDGLQPNVSEYSLTLPYYVCEEWGTQCVSDCGTDNTCSSSCRQDHPCGALNPTRVNTTSSASASGTATGTASGTTTANQIYTGFGTASAQTSTSASQNAAPPLDASRALGVVVTLAGLVAGAALIL